MFVDVFDVDQRPCVVVPASDSFEPCSFCWETGRRVEVLDGLLDTREFIDIENGVVVAFDGGFEVFLDVFRGGYRVFGI